MPSLLFFVFAKLSSVRKKALFVVGWFFFSWSDNDYVCFVFVFSDCDCAAVRLAFWVHCNSLDFNSEQLQVRIRSWVKHFLLLLFYGFLGSGDALHVSP